MNISTTVHATTKLFVPFCSVQDGDESAEYELFSVLSTLLKRAKFRQNNKSTSTCVIKEMNSYVGMTMVKKNRDKMIISINKAYLSSPLTISSTYVGW